METDMLKILQALADTAANAAEETKAAAQSAGKVLAEKFDRVKLNRELSRLHMQQERLFADMGRILFLMKTGAVKPDEITEGTDKTPQQTLDELLISAGQLQQERENIALRLAEETDGKVCPACGKPCSHNDVFCSACGAKLG